MVDAALGLRIYGLQVGVSHDRAFGWRGAPMTQHGADGAEEHRLTNRYLCAHGAQALEPLRPSCAACTRPVMNERPIRASQVLDDQGRAEPQHGMAPRYRRVVDANAICGITAKRNLALRA